MLDLYLTMLCICSLVWMQCSSTISSRLRKTDGIKRSEWLCKQRGNFTQYWNLSQEQHWSRTPVVLALIALASSLFFVVEIAVLSLPRVWK